MERQVRLNRYERGIVEALAANFDYSAAAARWLVVEYIGVIGELGSYDTCLDHAERLVRGTQAGQAPEAWLERIRLLDAEAARDKGIPHLEGTDYAHAHVR